MRRTGERRTEKLASQSAYLFHVAGDQIAAFRQRNYKLQGGCAAFVKVERLAEKTGGLVPGDNRMAAWRNVAKYEVSVFIGARKVRAGRYYDGRGHIGMQAAIHHHYAGPVECHRPGL